MQVIPDRIADQYESIVANSGAQSSQSSGNSTGKLSVYV